MTRRIPKYRRQKAPNGNDRAFVEIDGRRHYLGAFDTPESRQAYDRVIAEWLTHGKVPCQPNDDGCSVTDLCAAFWLHVSKPNLYRKPANFKPALREFRRLYGDRPLGCLGVPELETVQHAMVQRRWCRRYVNDQMSRLKQMLKWGKRRQLVPAGVWAELCDFESLRSGRTSAPDRDPVEPVTDEQISAIEPFVSRQVWAMVRLQRLSGARPGEVVRLRSVDLDMNDADLWVYLLRDHKSRHRGKVRRIPIFPAAQKVIRPFLVDRPLHAFMFSPAEAYEERVSTLREARKTRVQPSQRDRAKERPGRRPGERYATASYARAIARAVRRAYRPEDMTDSEFRDWRPAMHWHPNQIRHLVATEWNIEFGRERTALMLGHASTRTTDRYVSSNHQWREQICKKAG